jgi:hypothetical protein
LIFVSSTAIIGYGIASFRNQFEGEHDDYTGNKHLL